MSAWLFLEVSDSMVHRKSIDFDHVSIISSAVLTKLDQSIVDMC